MTVYDIDQAARITWRMTQNITGEVFQFGLSTGRREEGGVDDLLEAMEVAWDEELSGRLAQCTLREIVYAEWATSGFVGFHQVSSIMVSHASTGGNPLPPQCAVVVSLLNTTDTDVSLKRRRGRTYLGLIPTSHIDASGKYAAAQHDALEPAWANVVQHLINLVSASEAPPGPCIASAAGQQLITADKYGIGFGIDTQRRRRQKVDEAIEYQDHPTEPE